MRRSRPTLAASTPASRKDTIISLKQIPPPPLCLLPPPPSPPHTPRVWYRQPEAVGKPTKRHAHTLSTCACDRQPTFLHQNPLTCHAVTQSVALPLRQRSWQGKKKTKKKTAKRFSRVPFSPADLGWDRGAYTSVLTFQPSFSLSLSLPPSVRHSLADLSDWRKGGNNSSTADLPCMR